MVMMTAVLECFVAGACRDAVHYGVTMLMAVLLLGGVGRVSTLQMELAHGASHRPPGYAVVCAAVLRFRRMRAVAAVNATARPAVLLMGRMIIVMMMAATVYGARYRITHR